MPKNRNRGHTYNMPIRHIHVTWPTILERTRILIKNDTKTKISKLSIGKEIHGKTRNMRNIRNRKGRSKNVAATSNIKRSGNNSDNINRKNKRSERRESGRIKKKRQNPESMNTYLTMWTMDAQCWKHQSQNQQYHINLLCIGFGLTYAIHEC
jgi:hypothetical protein